MDHEDRQHETNGAAAAAHDAELEELRRRIQALQDDADRQLRALIQERPMLAIGLAVAAGFVLGRIMRRI